MNYTPKDLKTKNKDELIQIAKDLLKEKYPEVILNPNDYEIKVWKTRHSKTEIIFKRAIRYVSNKAEAFDYDITINLDTKEIIPFDNQELPFYVASKEGEQTISALKESGLLPKNNQPDIEYTITENEEYYLISCFDNLHHIDKNVFGNTEHPFLSKTLINKQTGETLFFKGSNPFYYLHQISCKHYYEDDLYTILKAENTSDKNDEITKIATSILKEKYPDLELNPNDFEIVILGNYKDIIVKYRRFIRFNKRNEKHVFDLAVNIITKTVSPFDTSENSFYTPSSSDKKAIKNIKKSIPLELGSNMEHTVSENEDYFLVTSISAASTKKYFINKKDNAIVWTNESYTLQMNNREDLTLQEHYKRENGLYSTTKSENMEPLIEMASAILKEEQFIPKINLDDYSITSKSGKNEVEVTLTRLVTFIPLKNKRNFKTYYNLNVNLVDRMVDQKPEQFYFPPEEDAMMSKLIETKAVAYFKTIDESDETYYPMEIYEAEDYFNIKIPSSHSLRGNFRKEYHMDKKTKEIEVFLSPNNFFPSPAMPPSTPIEITD
ncbi:hypothetical protein [Formosa sp. PL04]|uniref:hypothetical protein n=1 Tax=Formosa sp. PL04 TaxID=3081755 RepID=UPI00298244DE|nr:hypothetical protein [Formosa sp. PL04]MDW5289474.1 hypothetical protein [Formosa sp. PL04]